MKDRSHKEFVGRVNGRSIYWSSRYARQNPERFIIMDNKVQVYDTEDLYGAVTHCLEESKWTSKQRKRFIELATKFDWMTVSRFEK